MIMPLVKTSSFSVLLRLWRSLVTEAESCVVSRPSAVEHIIFSIEDTNGEYRSLCLWLTEDFIPFLAAKLPASIAIVDQAMKGVKALLVDLKEIRSLRTKYSMNL